MRKIGVNGIGYVYYLELIIKTVRAEFKKSSNLTCTPLLFSVLWMSWTLTLTIGTDINYYYLGFFETYTQREYYTFCSWCVLGWSTSPGKYKWCWIASIWTQSAWPWTSKIQIFVIFSILMNINNCFLEVQRNVQVMLYFHIPVLWWSDFNVYT